MNLVRDDDGKPLQPVRLVSEEAVGALGGCDDDVEAFQVWVNRIVVSYADADLESERLELLQVLVLLGREGPQRNNVEGLPTAEDRCEDREIRHEGLPACRRNGEDEILAEQGRPDRVRLRRIELFDPLFLQDLHDPRIETEVGDTHRPSDAERSA